MSGTLRSIDRLACLVSGLVLLAGGLVALDWTFHWAFDGYPEALSLGPVVGWVQSQWWPWAAGAIGFLLVVAGLRWLVAHLRRNTVRSVELPGSNQTGRLTIDLASVAVAARDEVALGGSIQDLRARAVSQGSKAVIQLRAHVNRHADGPSLIASATRLDQQLDDAFPEGSVRARITFDGPRRHRGLFTLGTPRVR